MYRTVKHKVGYDYDEEVTTEHLKRLSIRDLHENMDTGAN